MDFAIEAVEIALADAGLARAGREGLPVKRGRDLGKRGWEDPLDLFNSGPGGPVLESFWALINPR